MAVECPRCNTVTYSSRTTCGTCGNGLSSTRSNPSLYPLRQDDMMSLKHQKMAVFDIDATLFDTTQRTRNAIRAGVLAKDGSRPKGDRAFYKFFDKHSNPDEPISGTVDFVNSLARKNYVIAYLTARPRRVRKKTIETLEKAGYPVFNDHDNTPMVYLKIDGDETPKFKQDKLKQLQRRFNVLYFYDDLEANREMAQALDIPGVYDLRERLGIVASNPPTGGSKVTVWVVIHQGLDVKEFRGVYGSEEEAQHSFRREVLDRQVRVRFDHNHHIFRREITIPPASNPPTGRLPRYSKPVGVPMALAGNESDEVPNRFPRVHGLRTKSEVEAAALTLANKVQKPVFYWKGQGGLWLYGDLTESELIEHMGWGSGYNYFTMQPSKKNPSLESKGRELYAKFNGKKPASVKRETINIPPVWVKIGEGGVWSIGYNSGKETGDSNQKYHHNFNEDTKDGNFPDLYAAINEDGQAELLVIRGGTFKLETRDDGLTWLVD